MTTPAQPDPGERMFPGWTRDELTGQMQPPAGWDGLAPQVSANGQAPAPAERTDDPDGLGRRFIAWETPLESDADMAGAAARDALGGCCWAGGLGWRQYDEASGTWRLVPEEAITERVRRWMLAQTAYALRQAASAAKGGQLDGFWEALAGRWRKQATTSRIAGVTRLTRGVRLADPSRFDCQPDLLNCPNGVLNLRTGELGPHDPALLFTQVAGAAYDPDARHGDVDLALQAIPPDVLAYAQLRYGQAITGYKPPDDAIDVQHGSGENGKTTLLTAINSALGDYCSILPQRLLLASPDSHTTELMTLRGVRVGIIEELPEEHRIAVERIKIATAPRVTARLIYKDNVTFSNACALIISTNYRPQITETDHGTWRRLEGSIPFPYTFRKPHEKLRDQWDRPGDPALRQRIEADPDGSRARAMLAWLVAGAVRWYAGEPGRDPRTMGEAPATVREDLRAWRESCDVLFGFLSERLEFDQGAHVLASDLQDEIGRWLRSRGHKEWGAELLSARLSVHSDFREHQVSKERLRPGQGGRLSRPPGYGSGTPEKRYQAWLGIAFRTDETAGGQGGQAGNKPPYIEAQPLEVTSSPGHPGHAQFGYDFAALWAVADFGAQDDGGDP
ncbi:MAG TPA: phage/plasmid primase, P4 family [Streptosporangiaceae bacterium]|nr:phage/plasmid primase, P4 family [Streptosporangiaceae bacterium]